METTLDLNADIIDVRDIIARVESLEDAVYLNNPDNASDADKSELETLRTILENLQGEGGDEQWRGDWYPMLLVRDGHFTAYARELLEDCGTIPKNLPSWVEIDWGRTARNVRMDYSSIHIDGDSYWYR